MYNLTCPLNATKSSCEDLKKKKTLLLFPQNYSCPSVMVLAVPVAVRFLQRGNKELSRNMSSYLSLAAIAKADLLAEHTEAITLSVLGGRTHSHTRSMNIHTILLHSRCCCSEMGMVTSTLFHGELYGLLHSAAQNQIFFLLGLMKIRFYEVRTTKKTHEIRFLRDRSKSHTDIVSIGFRSSFYIQPV